MWVMGDLLGRVAIIPENNRYVLNQRVALLRINDDTNTYFLFSIINRYQDYFKKLGAGSSQLNISRGIVENFEVAYPNVAEQRMIADYFQSLDHLITLHHRECIILRKTKVNDWEQRKLGEIATYRNGKAHEANQLDVGTYELVNLNSISIDGGLKPSGKFIEDGSDTLQRNDLVMVLSDVGHGDLLGRVAIIPENNRYVLNQRVALLRINDDTNTYFLFSIINRYQDYFKKLGAGSSQLNISRGIVENFEVAYPNVAEQRMIADYFQSLDHLITLHHRECIILRKTKVNDWEQRKLGETKTFFTDGNYGEAYPKSSDMVDSSIGVPFLTGGNLKDGKLDISGASYISKENMNFLLLDI